MIGATSLLRHVVACDNARLPGTRRRLRVAGAPVGWVGAAVAGALAAAGARLGPDAIDATPAVLDAAVQALGATGLRLRGERFDVRDDITDAVVATIDRAALPAFGIRAEGVHVNGLVRRADGLHVWVARRSADRALDPGKLDHLVAGGVPAGLTPAQTLVKEAAEEASIGPALVALARPVATIGYAMERPEGLRRDRLHCFDLDLPEDFQPRPADDEVAGFALWPLSRALDAVRHSDEFKFNVNLVLIDLFLRTGLVDLGGPEGWALGQALGQAPGRRPG